MKGEASLVARNRSDITYGSDDLSRVGFWAPETPEFLEKRDERRAAMRSSAVSYTQAKANIRRVSIQNRAAEAAARPQSSDARIVDFGQLERTRRPSGEIGFEAEWSWDGNAGSGRIAARASRGGSAVRVTGRRSPSRIAAEGRRGGDFWLDDAGRARDAAVRHGDAAARREPEIRVHRAGERPNRFADQDFYEDMTEGREAEPERRTLRGRLHKVRHDMRARKADRAFARDYVQETGGDEGPRAAVYEGRMGRTHHRATRMQETARTGFTMPAFVSGIVGALSLDRLLAHRWFAGATIAVAFVLFAFTSIYPTAQAYYLQTRANDQLAAEYQAVVDRNTELEQHVSALQTDEGMEQLAHESLGWVREGEHSVSIQVGDSADLGSNKMGDTSAVAEGSVPAPETWYSPVLDAVFGYKG